MDSWPLTAAFVVNRNMRILASNAAARALSRFFSPGENILRAAFLEPELRMLYRDWDLFTTRMVPFVRAVLGAEPPDRELVELIGELSFASKRFAMLWARHDVKHRSTGPTAFYHPQVGAIDLHYTILHLPDQRQILVTYHADPGSRAEESLRLLASLTG
jgi:hypothetical protein